MAASTGVSHIGDPNALWVFCAPGTLLEVLDRGFIIDAETGTTKIKVRLAQSGRSDRELITCTFIGVGLELYTLKRANVDHSECKVDTDSDGSVQPPKHRECAEDIQWE